MRIFEMQGMQIYSPVEERTSGPYQPGFANLRQTFWDLLKHGLGFARHYDGIGFTRNGFGFVKHIFGFARTCNV